MAVAGLCQMAPKVLTLFVKVDSGVRWSLQLHRAKQRFAEKFPPYNYRPGL
jgi:hypothetical protein